VYRTILDNVTRLCQANIAAQASRIARVELRIRVMGFIVRLLERGGGTELFRGRGYRRSGGLGSGQQFV